MPTVFAQKLVARRVLLLAVIVAIAVKFNDQFGGNAREVGDETVDGMLTAKFKTFQATVAQ